MSINLFFDPPSEDNRRKTVPMASQVILWKCGNREEGEPGCGTNLPTEGLTGTEVKCTHCGKVWSIVPVKYAGQVR
jgi:hypothetical protein